MAGVWGSPFTISGATKPGEPRAPAGCCPVTHEVQCLRSGGGRYNADAQGQHGHKGLHSRLYQVTRALRSLSALKGALSSARSELLQSVP